MLTEVEQAFAKYVASQWTRLDTTHRYYDLGREDAIEFTSLEQAYLHYHFDGSGLDETTLRLNDLTARLAEELQRSSSPDSSSHKLHHVCLDILVWGGVERAAQDWLTRRCETGMLGSAINAAVVELSDADTAPSDQADSVFVDGDLGTPMDAGMTKICALAKADELVIYDGRVGAGLGYLTVQFLRGPGKEYLMGEGAVPPALKWAWGGGQSAGQRHRRNPTTGLLEFAALRPGSPNARLRHATLMWRASRVLRRALWHIQHDGSMTVKLSNLEMAIFMIGYDVRSLGAPR